MDPVTGLGIASASISIIAKIIPTILSVKETWDGIKQVDETNGGFIEELVAFEFSLTVIDTELRREDSAIEQSEWWDSSRMTDLLHNAVKTMSRLDVIFKDMSRNRKVLQSARSYYRGKMYESEIGHLTNRLRTYTSCLKLPTTIVAISSQISSLTGSRASTRRTQSISSSNTAAESASETSGMDDDTSTLFEKELVVTNNAIRTVLEDIPNICVPLDQRDGDEPGTSVKDSEELVELAGSIVNTMSSVASNAPLPSKQTDHMPARPTMRDWENVSVSGVPMSHESSKVVQAWSSGIPGLSRSRGQFDMRSSVGTISMFGDEHAGLDSQMVKHRFDLARRLYADRKYKEAVPHLEKTLARVDEHSDLYQDIQMLLAKTLMEIKPLSVRIEALLNSIVNTSTDVRNAEALGLLATVRMELYPNDLEKAKEICELAAMERQNIFGRYHEQTVESIWLMAHLCTVTHDSDAIIWRQMLPEQFRNLSLEDGAFKRAVSPFARQISSTDQVEKISKLEANVKHLKDLTGKKSEELATAAAQMRSLQESNQLKGEMLELTKKSHTELQTKYQQLQVEHKALTTTGEQLRQELVSEKQLQAAAMHSKDQAHEELRLKLQYTEAQHELQVDHYLEQLAKSEEDWLKSVDRERDLLASIESLKLEHAAEMEALRPEADANPEGTRASHDLSMVMAQLKTAAPKHAQLAQCNTAETAARLVVDLFHRADHGWKSQFERAEHLQQMLHESEKLDKEHQDLLATTGEKAEMLERTRNDCDRLENQVALQQEEIQELHKTYQAQIQSMQWKKETSHNNTVGLQQQAKHEVVNGL